VWVLLSDDDARRWLLHASGLSTPHASLEGLLAERRCVQLDPLDPIGANADLVAMARTDATEGALFDAVWPGGGFEHYAKERCLLPASAFPYYRDRAKADPHWRQTNRMQRLSEADLDKVEDEVRRRGPVAVNDLSDHGRVTPLDWNGWKGTGKTATMACEVLVLRCRLVVCGRSGRGKVVDVPERALPSTFDAPTTQSFGAFALVERVAAMGLMPMSSGPWWGSIFDEREALVAEALAAGTLEQVELSGVRKRWLAPAGFRDRIPTQGWSDDRMRVLGPLDPLLWDRWLVNRLFGFEYVWEVYKPVEKRRWGWYVCPLLHRGQLVGRFEGRRGTDGIEVLGLWEERGFERAAFEATLAHHHGRLSSSRGRS
jgi:uncharacterized protein